MTVAYFRGHHLIRPSQQATVTDRRYISIMSSFFAPNIGNKGRIARGVFASLLLGAAGFTFTVHWIPAVLLTLAGLFVLFESLRGWCVLRACKLKTPL
jgi:hypothetical protein